MQTIAADVDEISYTNQQVIKQKKEKQLRCVPKTACLNHKKHEHEYKPKDITWSNQKGCERVERGVMNVSW